MRRPRLSDHRTGFGVFVLGTGMGLITNLVTGDPEHWPRALRPVAEHAPLIGVALLVAVGANAAWQMWRNGIARPEWTGGNPYPGLLAYTERWAGVFFGRRTEVQELVTRVRQARAPAARFVPVVGPSGSGKSSLVLAGLLPALRGGPDVRVADPFTPGGNAVGELSAVLGVDLTTERRALDAARAGDPPPRLDDVLTALARLRAGSRGLLLVIDQLEVVRAAATTNNEQLRREFIELASLVWDHLPAGAATTDWRNAHRLICGLVTAGYVTDGETGRSGPPLGFVHQLLADADDAFEALPEDAAEPELADRLERARRIIDQHPARAAALLYQVLGALDDRL